MKRLGFLFTLIFILFCISYLVNITKEDGMQYQVEYLDYDDNKLAFGCVDEFGNVKTIFLDNCNIEDVIKYYTLNQNALPVECYSPLGYSAYVKEIRYDKDILYLNIDKIDNSLMINEFIECLKITSKNYQIKMIYLKIGLSEYEIKPQY